MARKTVVEDRRDAKIEQLETKLYMARATIIGMVPEPLREILLAEIWCKTFKDVHEWSTWAVEQLIERADAKPGHQMGDYPGRFRAYCPLCGLGAQTPYSKGFSLPTGLERHLLGSHQTYKCCVFDAAESMAMDRAREKRDGLPTLEGPGFESVPPWRRKPPPESATVIELRPTQP